MDKIYLVLVLSLIVSSDLCLWSNGIFRTLYRDPFSFRVLMHSHPFHSDSKVLAFYSYCRDAGESICSPSWADWTE